MLGVRVLGVAAARAVGQVAATMLVASALAFSLVPLFPGDPAFAILSQAVGPLPSAEAIAGKRAELGLDRPLAERYLSYLSSVGHGDLTRSWVSNTPVSELFASRAGATALLAGTALALALATTIALGLISAAGSGRWPDELARTLAIGGAAIPPFVLGLLCLQYVVIKLGVGKVVTDGTVHTLALPAAVLATGIACLWIRPLRALLLDALTSPAVLVARARGASRARVLFVHALPHAMVGFLPFVALGVGGLITGALVVEAVFSWPGLGLLVVEAVRRRDVPVIQGFTLYATFAYVVASKGADLMARVLDPRLRSAGAWAPR